MLPRLNSLALFSFFILIFHLSCYSPKQGALSAETRSELELLALSSKDPELKYHQLAEKLSAMLTEALKKNSEDASMLYLREFYQDNQASLKMLKDELFEWQRAIPIEEKVAFLLRVDSKPYANVLQRRRSQFRRQVNFRPDYVEEFDRLFSAIDFEN